MESQINREIPVIYVHSRPTLLFIHAMLSRTAAVLALAGSAAAFSPMMSMDMGRREIVKAGAAAAAVAPLLRPAEADATMNDGVGARNKRAMAPVITTFDHRGCNRGGPNKEFFGIKANGIEDEMLVKVQSLKIPMRQDYAEKFLQAGLR